MTVAFRFSLLRSTWTGKTATIGLSDFTIISKHCNLQAQASIFCPSDLLCKTTTRPADMRCVVAKGSEMGAGDSGMEDIYHWDQSGPRIPFKGPTGDTGT